MHHYRLYFHFFCSSKSFEIQSQCTFYHLCFHYYYFLLQFKIFLNITRVHALKTIFFLFFSLQFQIVSNTIRMHALETLFSKFTVQFQIASNTVRMHALEIINVFKIFSAIPNRFKSRQNACFRDIVFIFFSAAPNRLKYS